MDERLREVEGDVGTLKDWRNRTVDPWISSGKEFRETVGGFITKLKAQEEMRQELNDERHRSNAFKLNLIIAVGGLLTALFTALLVIATYQLAHQRSFLVPMNMMGSTTSTEMATDAGLPYGVKLR